MIRISLLIVTALTALGCQSSTSQAPPATAVTRLEYVVPQFTFTERSGRTVTNDDLKGKVWLAAFVFTRCTGPCPQVTATMARLQEEYKDAPDVMLVTFTIDPDRDSLSDLKKYADQYRADEKKWLFLTGKEAEIHALAVNGFKLLAKKSETPKPGEEFDHSSRIAVVDKAGVMQGAFEGKPNPNSEKALEASIGNLKALVKSLQH